jgi:iron-sulfur cluster assembly protein
MTIFLTERAKAHLIAYMTPRGADTVQFTLNGKGCGGMSYVLDIIPRESVAETDCVVAIDESRILAADHTVLPFIAGTTIDWDDGLNSSGFIFINPQAASTCGCGSSFNPRGGCA